MIDAQRIAYWRSLARDGKAAMLSPDELKAAADALELHQAQAAIIKWGTPKKPARAA